MSLIVIVAGGIGILAIILALVLMSYQESDVVKDTLDKEIQERLDEIQRIANESDYEPLPREWITSGPFQIDRSKYAIGEKIFIRTSGLEFNDKGQIAVMRSLNATHYSVYSTIPFDGSQKSGFNYYIDIQISKSRGLCSVDDMMGKWSLIFRGTNYPNLDFNITERIVPGTDTESVC